MEVLTKKLKGIVIPRSFLPEQAFRMKDSQLLKFDTGELFFSIAKLKHFEFLIMNALKSRMTEQNDSYASFKKLLKCIKFFIIIYQGSLFLF